MPRRNPLRVPAGASLYVWLKLYGNKHLSALQSAGNSLARGLPQGLYPRIFTSESLLGGQRGLDLLHDCVEHLQVEVHAQLQSTRRNEIGHGGKFSPCRAGFRSACLGCSTGSSSSGDGSVVLVFEVL